MSSIPISLVFRNQIKFLTPDVNEKNPISLFYVVLFEVQTVVDKKINMIDLKKVQFCNNLS